MITTTGEIVPRFEMVGFFCFYIDLYSEVIFIMSSQIYFFYYLTTLRRYTCFSLCSSSKSRVMLLATKQEKCPRFLSLYCFFLITAQESSKYFCLSVKPETCWYYHIVSNANTLRYLSKHFNLKHSKEIVMGSHSKHSKIKPFL